MSFFKAVKLDKSNISSTYELPRIYFYIFYPFSLLVKLWLATVRFNYIVDAKENLISSQKKTMIMLWHNRLFFMPKLYLSNRPSLPLCAMSSASKDGAFAELLFSYFKIKCVRGSSSYRGSKAFSDLLTKAKHYDLAIVLDGPRGPKYVPKRGALVAGKILDTQYLAIGINPYSYWTLKGWDNFILPKPFSKVDVFAKMVHSTGELLENSKLEEISAENYIENLMKSINDEI